jgi:hypothetical protein
MKIYLEAQPELEEEEEVSGVGDGRAGGRPAGNALGAGGRGFEIWLRVFGAETEVESDDEGGGRELAGGGGLEEREGGRGARGGGRA